MNETGYFSKNHRNGLKQRAYCSDVSAASDPSDACSVDSVAPLSDAAGDGDGVIAADGSVGLTVGAVEGSALAVDASLGAARAGERWLPCQKTQKKANTARNKTVIFPILLACDRRMDDLLLPRTELFFLIYREGNGF